MSHQLLFLLSFLLPCAFLPIPIHVSAQCQESSTTFICSNHGTCHYPSQPLNASHGYDPLMEGICDCDVATFEWDGTNSKKAEHPFCSGNVQDLPGMTSYINSFILPIGGLYLVLMIADAACLIKIAKAGEFRFNLRTVAMSLLCCKFLLNVIYFLVDPLNANHIYGSVGGAWLALLAEPFIITSYNLVFVFLRDLSSRHLKRQFNKRTIYWVTSISFFVSLALVGGTMAIGILWFYVGITLVYVILSSLAMFHYSWKILKQLQAVNASIHASSAPSSRVSHLGPMHSELEVIAEHDEDDMIHSHRISSTKGLDATPTPPPAVRLSIVIDSNAEPSAPIMTRTCTLIPPPAPVPAPRPPPLSISRPPIFVRSNTMIPPRPRIRSRTCRNLAVQNDSRHAIRQVAKISLGSSIVWFITGILMLFFILMGTTVTAKQYVMGFFAVELCNIAWGVLMIACFWPRHEMRVDDGSIINASTRSLHVNNKKKSPMTLKMMDESYSPASASAARYQIPSPMSEKIITTTPTSIKQAFITPVKH